MTLMLTEPEKNVISAIQGDIPIEERPYAALAADLGIGEAQFLEILQGLAERGIIRRFGATLRHQRSGYTANAMVAWKVDEEKVNAVGNVMTGVRQISHCYRRDPTESWPYNLYTMIHAKDEEGCRRLARRLSEKTDVKTYTLLFSRRELKKTSMRYF